MARNFSTLQSLRGLAALLVVCFHTAMHVDKNAAGSSLRSFWNFGDSGVQFFFVLSGFVIYHTTVGHLGDRSYLGEYLRKRIVRIYPPYWLVILALFPLYLLDAGSGDAKQRDFSYLLQSLTLLPNAQGQYLGVAWTLVYEVFFYGLFALALLWKRALPVVIGALLLGSMLRVFGVGSDYYWYRFLLNPNLGLFALGILASMACHNYDLRRFRAGLVLAGTLLYAVAILFHAGIDRAMVVPAYDYNVWLYGVASALIIVGATYYSLSAGNSLGDSSYALYITHIPVLGISTVLVHKLHLPLFAHHQLAFVLLVLACVTGGYVFHYWIEMPMLGYIKRLTYPK